MMGRGTPAGGVLPVARFDSASGREAFGARLRCAVAMPVVCDGLGRRRCRVESTHDLTLATDSSDCAHPHSPAHERTSSQPASQTACSPSHACLPSPSPTAPVIS